MYSAHRRWKRFFILIPAAALFILWSPWGAAVTLSWTQYKKCKTDEPVCFGQTGQMCIDLKHNRQNAEICVNAHVVLWMLLMWPIRITNTPQSVEMRRGGRHCVLLMENVWVKMDMSRRIKFIICTTWPITLILMLTGACSYDSKPTGYIYNSAILYLGWYLKHLYFCNWQFSNVFPMVSWVFFIILTGSTKTKQASR